MFAIAGGILLAVIGLCLPALIALGAMYVGALILIAVIGAIAGAGQSRVTRSPRLGRNHGLH
jgi:hypothetical protein